MTRLCACALTSLAWVFLLTTVLPVTAAEAPPHPLPVRRVVLFTSGVAFVEHRGEVEGNQTIEFRFPVEDVNDLLKSIVVQDDGGGKIEAILYTPQETSDADESRIDPSPVRSLGDMLSQFRGQHVAVELASSKLQGAIIGVDRRQAQVDGHRVVEQETLLLNTDTGLRTAALASVVSVQLTDEKLDRELQQAIEQLAMPQAQATLEKKRVSLRLRGEGKRQVRVGYVQEFPVWKTTYRLVMDANNKALLQGWAIVENTTDHDWQDVQVALVSGRPVSFVMDLYQPLFLARPKVVPELFAGLRPKVHDQDLSLPSAAMAGGGLGDLGGGLGGGGFGGGGFGGFAGGGFGGNAGSGVGLGDRAPDNDDPFAPVQSPATDLAPAPQGAQVGMLFRYAIEHPITLPKQQSAMLPLVNDEVGAARKAIFNPAARSKHPLAAIELTNTTKLNLMQGPLTLFDEHEYSGDAQMTDLAAQAKRLVTYALDLSIELTASPPAESPPQYSQIKIHNGRINVTKTQRRTHHYLAKNSHSAARTILIEQRLDGGWDLAEPKQPAEQTRDLYRFALEAPPGKSTTLTVVEERTLPEQIIVVSRTPEGEIEFEPRQRQAGFEMLRHFAPGQPAIQEILNQWLDKRNETSAITTQLAGLSDRTQEIQQDQARIRQNLAQLPEESELYRKYIATLSKQEDELQQLREQRAKANEQLKTQRADFETFLLELHVP